MLAVGGSAQGTARARVSARGCCCWPGEAMPIQIINSGVKASDPNTTSTVVFRNEGGVVCRTSSVVRPSHRRRGTTDIGSDGGGTGSSGIDRHATMLAVAGGGGDGGLAGGEGGQASSPNDMTSVFGLKVNRLMSCWSWPREREKERESLGIQSQQHNIVSYTYAMQSYQQSVGFSCLVFTNKLPDTQSYIGVARMLHYVHGVAFIFALLHTKKAYIHLNTRIRVMLVRFSSKVYRLSAEELAAEEQSKRKGIGSAAQASAVSKIPYGALLCTATVLS